MWKKAAKAGKCMEEGSKGWSRTDPIPTDANAFA